MKTKKFNKRLTLNKKTVSDLNDKEMKDLHGGAGTFGSCAYTCSPCDTRFQTCLPCPRIQTEYETCFTGWCC